MSTETQSDIVYIIGGGLVGSLFAVYLKKRGYEVHLYERWPDMRKVAIPGGRSINLVLTERGIRALRKVGLEEKAMKLCVAVKGRMVHSIEGNLTYQPYGNENEWNNSISRSELNKFLLDEAEQAGVKTFFNHVLSSATFDEQNETTTLVFEHKKEDGNSETITKTAKVVFGSDGGGSGIRRAMVNANKFKTSTEDLLSHGYKEIFFPAKENGEYSMQGDSLHIWPRGDHMLMTLANPDGSFTGTVYLPTNGENSFAELDTLEKSISFVEKYYSDAIPLAGGKEKMANQLFSNPKGILGTVRCEPWNVGKFVSLIGDAAHAIVPFFGQGCNCGFEDCLVFDRLLDQISSSSSSSTTTTTATISSIDLLKNTIEVFGNQRKIDSDAIADLALANFLEMRAHVGDSKFMLKKKIERVLEQKMGDVYRSKYCAVVYSHIPYSRCKEIGIIQMGILDELSKDIDDVEALDFEKAKKLVEERLTPFMAKENLNFSW